MRGDSLSCNPNPVYTKICTRSNLSDVLHNGGTDIFYTGDKSRVQMMVRGGASSGVHLRDHLVEGINVTGYETFSGGDLGKWALKGTVAINGVTYESYQYSTLAVEVLVQKGMSVTLYTREEFLEAGVKSVGSASLFDLVDDYESASVLQDGGPELFSGEPVLLSAVAPRGAEAGSGEYPLQNLAVDLLDQHQAQYAVY